MPPGHKVSQIPSKVSVSKAATSHKVNESESLYSKQIARVGYPALFNTSSVYVITADHHQPEQVLSTERLNNARAEETVALNLCRETKFQLEGRHSWNWKSESKIDQFSQVQASEVEVESNTRPAIWDWTQNPKLKVAASNPRNNKVHLEQRNDLGGQRVTSFLLSNSSETMWTGLINQISPKRLQLCLHHSQLILPSFDSHYPVESNFVRRHGGGTRLPWFRSVPMTQHAAGGNSWLRAFLAFHSPFTNRTSKKRGGFGLFLSSFAETS